MGVSALGTFGSSGLEVWLEYEDAVAEGVLCFGERAWRRGELGEVSGGSGGRASDYLGSFVHGGGSVVEAVAGDGCHYPASEWNFTC